MKCLVNYQNHNIKVLIKRQKRGENKRQIKLQKREQI
jgi:hypothetical protein